MSKTHREIAPDALLDSDTDSELTGESSFETVFEINGENVKSELVNRAPRLLV